MPTSSHLALEIPISPPQTSGIDDVYKSVAAATDPEVVQEGKKILESLSRLKYEMQHDRQLTYVPSPPSSSPDPSDTSRPIDDDGFPDVAAYNDELAKRGPITWLDSEWLYVECYLFR